MYSYYLNRLIIRAKTIAANSKVGDDDKLMMEISKGFENLFKGISCDGERKKFTHRRVYKYNVYHAASNRF